MRLRKKYWARPELEASDIVIYDKYGHCGKWREEFENNNPIHLELGCGMGGHISQRAIKDRNVNYIGIDLKDEVVVVCTKESYGYIRRNRKSKRYKYKINSS